MASVFICRFVDMDYMFNVSAGVGRNRPNKTLDVMLVQYLLRHAVNKSAKVSAGPGATSVQTTSHISARDHQWYDLKPDGIYGPMTQAFIDHYQIFRGSNPQYSEGNQRQVIVSVAVDGAIDRWTFPTKPHINFSTAGPMESSMTLAALSYDFAKSEESRHMSEMPAALAKILRSF